MKLLTHLFRYSQSRRQARRENPCNGFQPPLQPLSFIPDTCHCISSNLLTPSCLVPPPSVEKIVLRQPNEDLVRVSEQQIWNLKWLSLSERSVDTLVQPETASSPLGSLGNLWRICMGEALGRALSGVAKKHFVAGWSERQLYGRAKPLCIPSSVWCQTSPQPIT